MDTPKRTYLPPEMAVSKVELESTICGGSADIANPDTNQGRIETQKVNTEFSADFSSSTWDESPAN